MTTESSWVLRLWDEQRPVPPHELELLERQWQVKLPDGYKRLASMYQGMRPKQSIFRVGDARDVFSVLLTIRVYEGYEAFSIQEVHHVLGEYLPKGLYPFAKTPGGEHLYFDFRAGADQPQVVLVTEELRVLPVAATFEEFMEGLQE